MTPEAMALRDAFLAECWPVTREWHPTVDETAHAQVRNESLAASRGEQELPFREVA